MSAPKTIWAFHDGPMVGLFIGKKEVGSNIAEYTLTDPTTITLDRAKYEALVNAISPLIDAADESDEYGQEGEAQAAVSCDECRLVRAALKAVLA